MKRFAPILVVCLLLVACDDLSGEVLTPTRTLTGPTIVPSPTFFPRLPTEIAFDENGISPGDLTAAALPADAELPPLAIGTPVPGSLAQRIQITAEDGTLLNGDIYQSGETLMPGLLMLAPDHSAWGDFPTRVHNAGFTVLAMDSRQGQAASDVSLMLKSLTSGETDPARLAVIGADTGADAALIGCAGELLCDAVILLSPSGDQALLRDMTAFNPRPIFLAASQDDALSFDMVQRLQAASSGDVFLQPFTSAGHGLELLTNRPDLGDLIIQWLQQHLPG